MFVLTVGSVNGERPYTDEPNEGWWHGPFRRHGEEPLGS